MMGGEMKQARALAREARAHHLAQGATGPTIRGVSGRSK
jgi:hypothetical protein